MGSSDHRIAAEPPNPRTRAPAPSADGTGETINLYYDANRQRYKQVYTNSGNTETTMYIGGLLQKVSASGVDDYRYQICGSGELIAVMSRSTSGTNATRYLLSDHQGSVAKITDSSGNTVVSESFSAFGARRNPQTWSGQPTYGDLTSINAVSRDGYTGQTALGNLGLNHMNGRVQDAITGRFISADPYITEPGNTQNYNRYSYVDNNPITHIDPSGFSTVCITSTAGGGYGGVDPDTGLENWDVGATTTDCTDIPDPIGPIHDDDSDGPGPGVTTTGNYRAPKPQTEKPTECPQDTGDGNIVAGAGGAAVLIAAGVDYNSGGAGNLDSGQINGYATQGRGAGLNGGQYGLYLGGGVNVGYVKGPASNVGGPFINYMLAIPGTNFSITALFNPNHELQGVTIGFGPGIGFARTTTNTELYPIRKSTTCH